ncbi:MAG: hypothetical protein CME65_15205 [Halobacteriovoraceae bacterium]|nr:hypothetical protein [Halobacteriovoraceae bacterium]|tara:strand:- start:2526 stop:3041 length:516 start_codon:yes stop_codon:yes gene_type:complete
MKLLLAVLSVLSVFSAYSAEQDLELTGERWIAGSKGYLCEAFGEYVEAPTSHAIRNVKFEKLSTDYSLDNALVVATFEEDGVECRYSALLFADNALGTIELVESKSFSLSRASTCSTGKTVLDQQFTANNYLYWGHPHHVTIMMPDESAASICGEQATHIGVDFTLVRVIR